MQRKRNEEALRLDGEVQVVVEEQPLLRTCGCFFLPPFVQTEGCICLVRFSTLVQLNCQSETGMRSGRDLCKLTEHGHILRMGM